ncbi:MAG: hypothetical protein ACR2PL_18830 [Dehalococcoidia bacterium]
MAQQLQPIDIAGYPDLVSLIERAKAAHQPLTLRCNGDDVALLVPVASVDRQSKGLTEDDSLLSVIGIGESTGPGDVSSNKHRYVAQAIYAESHPTRLDP